MAVPRYREINALVDRLDPRTFEDFVFDVLEASMDGYGLKRDITDGPLRIDVLAEPIQSKPDLRNIAFEIKKTQVTSADVILSQLGRRESLQRRRPSFDFVLVITGGMTRAAKELVAEHNLTVWNVDDLARRLDDKIRAKWFGIAAGGSKGAHQREPSRAEALSSTLAQISPGDVQALEYQQWVADALEYLFVPPLGPVHYEASDFAKRNRRDVILENWAQDGFWAQARIAYSADQVVVDAKNSAMPLTKRPVVDLAHYLKPYGCGMFGILCCRKGAAVGARHAIREQWIGGKKLIVVLSDETLLDMLRRKSAGQMPEELLRHQIARFRNSL
jgi:hypothetical protein